MRAGPRIRRLATLSCLLLLLLVLAGCGGSDDRPGALTITNSAGARHRLQVEIADTPEERQHGLMGRTELSDSDGMLFDFEGQRSGFWMKDTLIPLSAAFIDRCGAIVALADMQPLSLQIHNTDREYRFGLEVKGGWFAARRVAVGDKVTLPKDLRDPGCG